jgi:hypothetical protein
MSMIDEVTAKMKAQQAGANNQDCCTEAQCGQAVAGIGYYRRPTLQEEAEKQAIGDANYCNETENKYHPPPQTLRKEAEVRLRNHREHARNASLAAEFFRDNPAFDEFVRLVRAGVIQF